MAELKTGKRPATDDDRDLRFADYVRLPAVLPDVPKNIGHEHGIGDWGMLGNGPDAEMGPAFDGTGDCVWAGAAHETMLWTHTAGHEATFNTHGVLADYAAVTGYKPSDPDSDQGTEVRAALKYRRATGVVDAHAARHKIAAFVALEPGNLDHLYAALYLFGTVAIGFEFPESAMTQFEHHKPWTPVHGARIDGGHYVPLVARREGHLECVSWARLQRMSVSFLQTYCDEAWAMLSTEMLDDEKTSPEGFDLAQLRADLRAVTA